VKSYLKGASLPLTSTFACLGLSTECSLSFLNRSDSATLALLSSQSTYKQLLIVSLLHLLGTSSTVFSIANMAVSFTHVVKAAEPVFTIVWTFFLAWLNKSAATPLSRSQFIAVFLVVLGVILASVSESSFSWGGLAWGLLSNVSFSGRNVLSKAAMTKQRINRDLLYLIMNISAIAMVTIPMLLIEGSEMFNGDMSSLFYSSISYYLYTAISMNILEGVSPVTHAIANTCKRLVLVITATIVFGIIPSYWSGVGALVTIGAVAFYSLLGTKDTKSAPPSSSNIESGNVPVGESGIVGSSYTKYIAAFAVTFLLFLIPSVINSIDSAGSAEATGEHARVAKSFQISNFSSPQLSNFSHGVVG